MANKKYPVTVHTQKHGFVNVEDGATVGAIYGLIAVSSSQALASPTINRIERYLANKSGSPSYRKGKLPLRR